MLKDIVDFTFPYKWKKTVNGNKIAMDKLELIIIFLSGLVINMCLRCISHFYSLQKLAELMHSCVISTKTCDSKLGQLKRLCLWVQEEQTVRLPPLYERQCCNIESSGH